jgi:hypothetical protein
MQVLPKPALDCHVSFTGTLISLCSSNRATLVTYLKGLCHQFRTGPSFLKVINCPFKLLQFKKKVFKC